MAAAPTSTADRGRRPPRVSGDDRQRAILETAERLLDERPLHEISVDDLAQGAGISRPTFYFYFASKEAVLLTLLDRMVEEARVGTGEALEHLADDPPALLRRGITAVYETFRAHRAVSLAAADARTRSPEVGELWAGVMERFVEETAAAIEFERQRGAAPDGIPARELAISLNLMNERVLHATFAGETPSVAEADVVEALVAVWLGAIYGPALPPPAVERARS